MPNHIKKNKTEYSKINHTYCSKKKTKENFGSFSISAAVRQSCNDCNSKKNNPRVWMGI